MKGFLLGTYCVSYVAYHKIALGYETNKSGSELQVCTSTQVIIVLSSTRIPYMVIVYIHIWYLFIVSHI